MESGSDSSDTEASVVSSTAASFEVEDFSPPVSPGGEDEAEEEEVEDFSPPASPGPAAGGNRIGGAAGPPRPYQFEPLASGTDLNGNKKLFFSVIQLLVFDCTLC